MMSWENYLNNFGISDIIALAALFGTLYTYIKHERRLKRQLSKINSYTIKENEEKERSKKSANINCFILNNGGSSRTLRICNDGIADALNIKVVIDCDTIEHIEIRDSLEYPQLNQYGRYDIFILKYTSVPKNSSITISWSDKLGKHSKTFTRTF